MVSDAFYALIDLVTHAEGPVARATVSNTNQGIFSKLTDSSLYTGEVRAVIVLGNSTQLFIKSFTLALL